MKARLIIFLFLACLAVQVFFVVPAQASKARSMADLDDLDEDDTDNLDNIEDEDVIGSPAPATRPAETQPAKPSRKPASVVGAEDEEDDVSFDEDEYVGTPSPDSASKNSSPKPAVSFGASERANYFPEILAVIFTVIYAVNFLIGRRTNDRIAQLWLNEIKPILESQFSVLGSYDDPDTKPGTLLKDSQSCFKFWASGRRHCTGMLATLELRKRHDLFGLLLAMADLSTVRDSVLIEIPINEDEMEPFVFAVVRCRQERKMRKMHKDLEYFSKVVKSDRLPDTLVALGDNPQIERELMEELVVRVLRDSEGLFEFLHVTDQNSGSLPENKCVLRIKLNLPDSPSDYERLKTLTKMTLHLLDRICEVKLSQQALTRAKEMRRLAAEKMLKETQSQRKEALAKRKEELKRQEEESGALSPEALRAARRKKEDKLLKKRQAARVKILR